MLGILRRCAGAAALALGTGFCAGAIGLAIPVTAHAQVSASQEQALADDIQNIAKYTAGVTATYFSGLEVVQGEEFNSLLEQMSGDDAAALRAATDGFKARAEAAKADMRANLMSLSTPPVMDGFRRIGETKQADEFERFFKLQFADAPKLVDEVAALLDSTVAIAEDTLSGDGGDLAALSELQTSSVITVLDLENRQLRFIQKTIDKSNNPRWAELELTIMNNSATIAESELDLSDIRADFINEDPQVALERREPFLKRMDAAISGWEKVVAGGRRAIPRFKRVLDGAGDSTGNADLDRVFSLGDMLMANFGEAFDNEAALMKNMEARVALYRTLTPPGDLLDSVQANLAEEGELVAERIRLQQARLDAVSR